MKIADDVRQRCFVPVGSTVRLCNVIWRDGHYWETSSGKWWPIPLKEVEIEKSEDDSDSTI